MGSRWLSRHVCRGAAGPLQAPSRLPARCNKCHYVQAPGFGGWNGSLALKMLGKEGKKPNVYLVGVAGFEPATPASRTDRCASKTLIFHCFFSTFIECFLFSFTVILGTIWGLLSARISSRNPPRDSLGAQPNTASMLCFRENRCAPPRLVTLCRCALSQEPRGAPDLLDFQHANERAATRTRAQSFLSRPLLLSRPSAK